MGIITTLTAAFLVAGYQEPLITQDDLCVRTVEFLRREIQGHVTLESTSKYHSLTQEDFQHSLQYMEQVGDCLLAVTAEDRKWASTLVRIGQKGWVPPAFLQKSQRPSSVVTMSEHYWRTKDGFRQVLVERTPDADGRAKGVAHHILHAGGEVVRWTNDGRHEWRRITRSWNANPEVAVRGGPFVYNRLRHHALVLLDIAKEQGGLSATASKFTFVADIRRPLNLKLVMEKWIPPCGVLGSPGQVIGSVLFGDDNTQLMIHWMDCAEKVIVTQSIVWNEDDASPCEITQRCFVPGKDQIIRESRISLVQVSSDIDDSVDLNWKAPSDLVHDGRFSVPLMYIVDQVGEVPSDAVLLQRSEHERYLRTVPFASESGYRLVSNEEGLDKSLVPDWRAVDVGEQAIGSLHNIEFELRNIGPDQIELGAISTDCGCLNPGIGKRQLAPGESTMLFASQQITKVGQHTNQIRVQYKDRNQQETLSLAVQATGVSVPLIAPDPVDLGTVNHGESVAVSFSLLNTSSWKPEDLDVLISGEKVKAMVQVAGSQQMTVKADVRATHLGAFVGSLEVKHRRSGENARAMIAYEAAPKGAKWPPCRVLLSPDDPKGVLFALPNTSIEEILGPPLEGIKVRMSQVSPNAIRLCPSIDDHKAVQGQSHYVRLSTSLGEVGLLVVVPSKSTTIERETVREGR